MSGCCISSMQEWLVSCSTLTMPAGCRQASVAGRSPSLFDAHGRERVSGADFYFGIRRAARVGNTRSPSRCTRPLPRSRHTASLASFGRLARGRSPRRSRATFRGIRGQSRRCRCAARSRNGPAGPPRLEYADRAWELVPPVLARAASQASLGLLWSWRRAGYGCGRRARKVFRAALDRAASGRSVSLRRDAATGSVTRPMPTCRAPLAEAAQRA